MINNKYIILFITACSLALILGFINMSISTNLYYGAMIITFLLSLPYFLKSKLNIQMSLLMIIILLSLLFNNIPTVFNSNFRFVLFFIVTAIISPLFENTRLMYMRMAIFRYTMLCCTIVTIGSFFCFFLGVNYMTYDSSVHTINTAGVFSGLTKHSMLLGPIAAISFCFLFCYNLSHRFKSGKMKYLFICFLFISLLCLLISSSRGAFISCLAASLYILYRLNQNSFHKLIKSGVIIILVFLVSYPLLANFSEGLVSKQKANETALGTLTSRIEKFENRKKEFMNNPVLGIGFAAVDLNSRDYVKELGGSIEPGTSWGAILSMTGILGFGAFIFLFFTSLISVHRRDIEQKIDQTSVLLGALLVFFGLHMIVEGYIFAGGSYLFYLFWLLMGVINANKYSSYNIYQNLRSL